MNPLRLLPMLAFVLAMGCAHSKKDEPAKFVTWNSCEALTNAFRGYQSKSFPTNWVCENGVLRCVPGTRVDLVTIEKYEDFDLELDWKVTRGANSGVLYGVSEAGTDSYWSGPEMQVNDDPNHKDGKVPNRSAGALYDLIAPNGSKQLFRTGEYNHARIVSRKGHVEHWLNGAKLLEYEWNSKAMREAIAKSKFNAAPLFMKNRNGHIVLQHHGDEVFYRFIRIKRL